MRAENEIRTLVNEYPKSPDAHAALAALLLAKNDDSGARRAFEQALQLNPEFVEALTGLVAIDIANRKPQDATARLEKMLAAKPDSAPTLVRAAKVYGIMGDIARVEALLKRALKADSSNPEAYGMLGQLYVDTKRVDEAKQYFADLARVQPQSVVGPTMLGLIAYTQSNRGDAQKWWERALEIDPQNAAAANNLAWLFAEGDANLDVALQLARTAKAKFPDQPDINDTLGWVYYKKKAAPQAIGFLRSAEKDAKNPMYHFHLGMAYAQAGDDREGARISAVCVESEFVVQRRTGGAQSTIGAGILTEKHDQTWKSPLT